MSEFQGKVVVVTGGSAGVGRATVEAFAHAGWDVGILARGQARLDAAAVEQAADTIERTLGPIDVWVNNAMATAFSPVAALTAEEFLRGTAAEVRAQLAARDSVKGEITLLIGKATSPPPDDTPIDEAVDALVKQGVGRMDAIKQVARRRGLPKREVYKHVV